MAVGRLARTRQGFIAVVGSLVDQQKIDRDDFRLQPRDLVDNPGKINPGERVAACQLHGSIVDRDNGQKSPAALLATNKRSKVGHRRFGVIEKLQVTISCQIDAETPKPRQNEGNQGLEMATAHSLFTGRVAPSRQTRGREANASRSKGPAASTSTPSPGPRKTL